MFLKFRTVAKVMRVLNDRGLDLPRRDRHGDQRWARATVASVAAILKNPAYAGAFVYGRTRMRTPTRRRVAGESAAAYRGMANCRERPVSRLHRLADLRKNPHRHKRQPGRIHAHQDPRRAPRRRSSACTASPGARDAVTRCTSATRAAASMYATICAPTRACRPASTSAPHASTQPWRTRS